MMKGTTEVTIETILISVLNVAAVYVAAFTYKLNWIGVMTVMIIASLLTAGLTHFILSKMVAAKQRTEAVISEGLGVLGVALLSSLAVLIILTQRFNFPQALGISLLSGVLSSLVRHMMA
jgi:ABC-type siderophore export system fused ATPase/permease subunit